MYYEFTNILDKNNLSILKEESVLFAPLPFIFKNHYGNQFNFKIFLIEEIYNKENKYYVLAHTKYISDNDFTSNLQAYDRIHYPISMLLNEKFTKFEDAELFFNSIVNKLPKPLNLNDVLSSVKVYGFDSRKSVNYDFRYGKRYADDKYSKDILCYNYTKFFIRMFRHDNEILINKSLILEFEDVEKAIEVFKKIKDYFKEFETIILSSAQSELHILLDKLIKFVISENVNNLELKKDKDDFKRFTMLYLRFGYDNYYFNIKYNLPTRNGDYHNYTTDSSVSISSKENHSYKSYNNIYGFIEKLYEICDILNIV